MNKSFWLFGKKEDAALPAHIDAEYCPDHGGYHPVIILGDQPIVPSLVYRTQETAMIVAHDTVVALIKEEGGFALPVRMEHLEQDDNAHNN